MKGTMDYGIHYTWYPKVLERCSDSNWISDAYEIKAMSGYMFNSEMALFPVSLASKPT
jgi:hypothetical protein